MIAAEVAVPKVKGEGVTDKLKELKLSPVSTVDAAVGGNVGALTINVKSVAAGGAVQFKVSGQKTTGSPYKLKITASTNSADAGAVRVLHRQG
jgi:hypothetical protein